MIQVHDLRHVEPDVAEAWADHISQHIRKQDRDEVEASSGLSPKDALMASLLHSTHAYAVTDRDGQPVAMFGAAPHPLPGVGVVWMLGTEGIRREAYSIAKATRAYFDELNAAYWLLWNYVDGRNSVSMRWLRWGGFKLLGEHTSRGPEGATFFTFARSNIHPLNKGNQTKRSVAPKEGVLRATQ